MQRIPFIYVAPSKIEGRGVYTSENIEAGTLLEICPVIVVPEKDVEAIHHTALHDYYYFWGEEQKEACIVLGFGSMFNHSTQPNAEVVPAYDNLSFNYYALTDIKAGEEILVNYNGDEDDTLIWFEER